jgi:predicted ATPase
MTTPFRSVITGGPGAGKSTLLTAISGEGIQTFPEVARAILKETGGMEMRAARPADFALAMLAAELEAWDAAMPCPVLYDRGFPDIVGFLDLEGLSIPAELDRVCREQRYAGPIFHAPPWREIYAPDEERIQDWTQAVASDAAISSAWMRYGYDLVDLPFTSVADRVQFVLKRLSANQPRDLSE